MKYLLLISLIGCVTLTPTQQEEERIERIIERIGDRR